MFSGKKDIFEEKTVHTERHYIHMINKKEVFEEEIANTERLIEGKIEMSNKALERQKYCEEKIKQFPEAKDYFERSLKSVIDYYNQLQKEISAEKNVLKDLKSIYQSKFCESE